MTAEEKRLFAELTRRGVKVAPQLLPSGERSEPRESSQNAAFVSSATDTPVLIKSPQDFERMGEQKPVDESVQKERVSALQRWWADNGGEK
jgi:hypothetical protein